MSDIISRRQRTPWFWFDFVYYCFGDGREHNKNLKILQAFTYKVSNWARGLKNLCLFSVYYIQMMQKEHSDVSLNFILSQVIHERAENISYVSDSDQGKKKRRAFLDMLLKTTDEDGNRMSHQDIQEEVDTFMFRVGG